MIDFSFTKILNEGKMTLNVSIKMENVEILTLYGESGVGKTSILRMLCGLMKPDSGSILVGDETWYDSEKGLSWPPQKRKVGMVFQDYALFPNFTVIENLKYAQSPGSQSKYLEDIIEVMELGNLRDRKPDSLSGGQKQRVALARALVNQPEVLLLDEPLSALDTSLRIKLQDLILNIHKEFNLPIILVSHEVNEIFRLSQRVVHLENGEVISDGKPLDIFTQRNVSGKFQFTGEVVDIQKEDVIWVLTILIGNQPVKVAGDREEIRDLSVGDKVMLASKAFNPLIIRIT